MFLMNYVKIWTFNDYKKKCAWILNIIFKLFEPMKKTFIEKIVNTINCCLKVPIFSSKRNFLYKHSEKFKGPII